MRAPVYFKKLGKQGEKTCHERILVDSLEGRRVGVRLPFLKKYTEEIWTR